MIKRNRNRILGTISIFAVTLSATLAGCVGSVDTGTNNDVPTWEEFRDNTYREPFTNGVFVLNGDEIIVDEKKLEEYYQGVYGGNGALIVHQNAGVDAAWDANQRQNLSYCISNDFANAKNITAQAMAEATSAWEAAADVKFQYVETEDGNCNSNNNNVLFDVGLVQNQPYLARAFFPGDNRQFRNVYIDASSFGQLGTITLRGILQHELGHVLGFRHEHTRPESGAAQCFEDDNWRPLTQYDQLSVMHYPQCGGVAGRDLDITATDRAGAAALYGNPGSTPPVDPNQPRPGTPQTGTLSDQLNAGDRAALEPIPVLPGTVLTATIQGTGDADLYVRFDQAPNQFAFDCRPFLNGSFETCSLDVPTGASTAHLAIEGYTNATFDLSVEWTAP